MVQYFQKIALSTVVALNISQFTNALPMFSTKYKATIIYKDKNDDKYKVNNRKVTTILLGYLKYFYACKNLYGMREYGEKIP